MRHGHFHLGSARGRKKEESPTHSVSSGYLPYSPYRTACCIRLPTKVKGRRLWQRPSSLFTETVSRKIAAATENTSHKTDAVYGKFIFIAISLWRESAGGCYPNVFCSKIRALWWKSSGPSVYCCVSEKNRLRQCCIAVHHDIYISVGTIHFRNFVISHPHISSQEKKDLRTASYIFEPTELKTRAFLFLNFERNYFSHHLMSVEWPHTYKIKHQLRLLWEARQGLKHKKETRDFKTTKFVEACFEAAPQVSSHPCSLDLRPKSEKKGQNGFFRDYKRYKFQLRVVQNTWLWELLVPCQSCDLYCSFTKLISHCPGRG